MIFPSLSQTNVKQFTIDFINHDELTAAAQDYVKYALRTIDRDSEEIIAKPHGVGYRMKTVRLGDELHQHLIDDWLIVNFGT